MTSQKPDEKGFGFIELILVLLVILILCAAGWIVYRDHTKTTVKTSASTANQKTQSYLTYTDPEKAYQVSYPVGWKVVNQTSSGISQDTPLDSATAEFSPSTLPKAAQGQTYISIGSFKSNNLTNIFLIETGLIGFTSGLNRPEALTINGYSALYAPLCISATSNSETCNSGSAEFYYYGVAHNGVVLVFQFQSAEPAGQSSPAFNASNILPAYAALVNSVKFLN
jgi:Tfp pilus assembly protein PilE